MTVEKAGVEVKIELVYWYSCTSKIECLEMFDSASQLMVYMIER
jgi:hypothetical protein